MRKHATILSLLTVLLAGMLAVAAHADDQGMDKNDMEKSEKKMPDMADMEVSMELAKPGPHHEHMAQYAGSWAYEMKMWMEPGAEAMESSGKAMMKPILDGRFLKGVYTGDFMGMPFEGQSIDGYDNYKKIHTSYWIDTMGTMSMLFTGTCSDDHKTLTMTAEFTDPASGQTMTAKTVTTMVDDDKYTMDYYMVSPEGEFKSIEMVATRQ